MRKGLQPDNSVIRTGRERWKYDLGEPIATFDTTKAEKSVAQLETYMYRHGYFDGTARFEVKYKKARFNKNKEFKNRVIGLDYFVTPGEPYLLENIYYNFKDSLIGGLKDEFLPDSLLRSGQVFSVDKMDEERERIADFLQENGYYGFSKEFINYQADSTLGDRKINVELILNPRFAADANDSLIGVPHKRYKIGAIEVHTNYDPRERDHRYSDTLYYDGIYILSDQGGAFKPELLAFNSFFETGTYYKKSDLEKSYRRLSALGVFESVGIVFEPNYSFTDGDILKTKIFLNPSKKQAFSTGSNLTHRDGNLGLSGDITYSRKNVFGGAEKLEVTVNGGVESNPTSAAGIGDEESTNVNLRRGFNTYEVGGELKYTIPKAILRGSQFFKTGSVSGTQLSVSTNYQNRPDFERTLWQLKGGIYYTGKRNNEVIFDLVNLSLIKIEKSQAFEDRLLALNDLFLLSSYEDHFILSSSVGFITSNKKKPGQRRYVYNKSSVEWGGSILRGLGKIGLLGEVDELGSYQIFDIRFAHFVKIENEFKWYASEREHGQLVFRLKAGVGDPFANRSTLPFQKTFIAGGSNDLRAWQSRTLGPGSFRDPTAFVNFNNIGEIKLISNAELRFDITPLFEGAVFVDAGNIWLFNEDPIRAGAEFRSNRFLSEIAIGSGAGVRLDFGFFLIRLDLGFQLKDPAKVPGERWFWEPKEEYNAYLTGLIENGLTNVPSSYSIRTNFNVGIGYPF